MAVDSFALILVPSLVKLQRSFSDFVSELIRRFSVNPLQSKIETISTNLGDFEIKVGRINVFFRKSSSELFLVFCWKKLLLNVYLNQVARQNTWGAPWKILELEQADVLYSLDSQHMYSFFGDSFHQIQDKSKFSEILSNYNLKLERSESDKKKKAESADLLEVSQSELILRFKPEILVHLVQMLSLTKSFKGSSVTHILKKLLIE